MLLKTPYADVVSERFVPYQQGCLYRLAACSVIFLTLQDASGRLQISLRLPTMAESDLAVLRDTLDLGDFLGVAGVMWTTRTWIQVRRPN